MAFTKKTNVSISIPLDIKADIEKIAEEEDRSLSNTVMRLLIEALAWRDGEDETTS